MLIQLSEIELEGLLAKAVKAGIEAYNGASDVKAVSIAGACERMSLGKTKIHQLLKSGHLSYKKVGRKTLISTKSIHDYLNK